MKHKVELIKLHPRYLRTGKMAELIGRSTKWLKQNKDVLFIRGVHYYQPDGEREPFWDIQKIDEWIRSQNQNEEVAQIVNSMLQ
jgi:hypothetical protein